MHHNHAFLYRLSRTRYVELCDRSAVHIQWDNLTLTWRLRDFRRIVAMIRRQMAERALPVPCVHLRINRMTLGLPTEEFRLLAEMLLSAEERLEQRVHRPVCHAELPPDLHCATLFSLS